MSATVKCSCGFENHTSCTFCIQCGKTLPGTKPRKARAVKLTTVEPPPAGAAPERGTPERVEQIAKQSGVAHEKTRAGWRITVPVDERPQPVHVLFDGKDAAGNDVITFLAVAAPANDDYAVSLLAQNSKLMYCAFAIRRFKKKRYFAVTASQLAKTADPEEVRATWRAVAVQADRLRRKMQEDQSEAKLPSR